MDIETAVTLERNGDFIAALRMYRDILAGNPQNEDAILGIAQCALALDNIDLAFEFFVRLLILNHNNPWGYIGRANVLFQYGQSERALSDLARAIEIDTPASACRIDCAALLNEYGYCDLAYESILPIRNEFILNPDFISEWFFAILAAEKKGHKDIPIILSYLKTHEHEDPFYTLCLLAHAHQTAPDMELSMRHEIDSFLNENPELYSRAATLHLCGE